jgi:Flp pilus assembly protein TadG
MFDGALPMMMRLRRRRSKSLLCSAIRDGSGNAMLQFAMILPAFVMLIFGVIEVGRGLWLQNALHYATEQAARWCSVNQTTCSTATVGSYAAGLSGANFPASAFTLSTPTSPNPLTPACGNQVDGSYSARLYIPYFQMTWTLTARSCFPKWS